MPDISMCDNKKCTKRMFCYRYLAKPSERQAFATFEQDGDGYCDDFMNCFSFRSVRSVEEVDKLLSQTKEQQDEAK